jgi:hypothetical protein
MFALGVNAKYNLLLQKLPLAALRRQKPNPGINR